MPSIPDYVFTTPVDSRVFATFATESGVVVLDTDYLGDEAPDFVELGIHQAEALAYQLQRAAFEARANLKESSTKSLLDMVHAYGNSPLAVRS